MALRPLALVACLPLALATVALAGPTVDVARRDAWKPGDAITCVVVEEDVQGIELPGHEVAPPKKVTTQATLVERCIEADASSLRTRFAVWVQAFRASDGETNDTTLSGAWVEVVGLGPKRTWKVVKSAETPGKAATAWLERRYGGGRADADVARRVWMPKVPVAVGDTWTADLASFLEGNPVGPRIDRAKMTSRCTLESVEKGFARIPCEASLPMPYFPAAIQKGQPVPWSRGGVMSVNGTLSVAVEGRLVASTVQWVATLEGAALVGDATIGVTWRSERRETTTVGGETPDPGIATLRPPVVAPPK